MLIKKDDLKLPIKFEFAKYTRYISLTLGIVVICWSLFIVIPKLYSDAHILIRLMPFLVIFLGFDVVQKNLFSIKKIVMSDEALQFFYIAKKRTYIKWENLLKIEKYTGRGKFFLFHYKNNDKTEKYFFPMAHKDIIDILNFIKIIAPHIETDEFVSSLLIKIEKP